jgi:hypothetical protein
MDALSIIGGITGIVSLIIIIWKIGFQWSGVIHDVKALEKDVDKLSKEQESLRTLANDCHTKIEPFWEVLRQQLPSLLTVQRSRNLLEKLSDDSISNDELIHLEEEMQKGIPDSLGDKGDALTKVLCLWAIKVIKRERKIDG